MTKISQYSTDVNITGNDKWIGSDAQNFLITKNFTPNNLASFFNENNVIDIGASIRYRYQTLLPGEAREQGTISFETEIGPQVNFSAITTFLIAKNTLKGNTVTQYLDFLVDGKVLLSKASNINIFGYYKITSIEPWIPNTDFFVVEVDFLAGNGFIYEDLDYLVSLVDKAQEVPPPVWGSITGDIEDQTDLINYISSQITIPTLQEVTDEGNITTNPIIFDDTNLQVEIGSISGFPYFKMLNIELGQATLFDNSDNTNSRYAKFQDKDGTLAYLDDITTPTLQEVLDNNHDLVDGNNFQGTAAGVDNTGISINAFGDVAAANNTGDNVNALGLGVAFANLGNDVNALGFYAGYLNEGSAVNSIGNNTCASNTGDNVNALGTNAGVDNTFNNVNLFGENATADEAGQTVLSKDGTIMARISTADLTDTRKYNLPDASGTLALTSDIPTTSGIPHATAAGTDTYTATVTGVVAYNDADAYLIRFTNGNTTGATLNINSLGAIPLYRNNDGPLLGGDILAGGEMLCIYNSTTNRFQVIGISPNSLIAYVTNDDSVTLTKGMPVYAFSGTGDRMTVKRANNTGDATSAQTVGLVLSTSIAANQKGVIMMQGLLDGLSILPTATWNDGDPVYLGSTPGTITNIKPYAPNHLVYLGVVTTASNGAAGRMYVRVQNGYELQELHNVQAQSPSLNDTLWYDSTVSPGQWKTASIPTIIGYTPANIASPTFTGTVTTPAIIVSSETASRVAIIDGSKNVKSADTATYPSLTELSYGKGVTSAIQTQLNARCVKLFNLTPQVTLTGTTAKTIIATYYIPANTFSNGDFLNFSALVTKVANINITTHTLEINTTNTLTGATIISTAGFNTTNFSLKFKREMALNNGNIYLLNISNNTPNDQTIGATSSATSVFTYNLAADLYFFVTAQLTSASDSITYRGIQITD